MGFITLKGVHEPKAPLVGCKTYFSGLKIRRRQLRGGSTPLPGPSLKFAISSVDSEFYRER